MNFKSRTFFLESLAPGDFGAPGCHPSTLTDLVKTALAIRYFVKTICMISEGYRTHRGVTGPMNFKSRTFFFFGKSCSRNFGAIGCHPDTLIDLANIALASRLSREPIRMICEGYRTHRGVTGPMNFKKSGLFFENSCSRGFGALGCHPSILIDLANTGLANKSAVETIRMFSECYRFHRGVTGPMNFKKNHDIFFSEIRAPGILGPLTATQAL